MNGSETQNFYFIYYVYSFPLVFCLFLLLSRSLKPLKTNSHHLSSVSTNESPENVYIKTRNEYSQWMPSALWSLFVFSSFYDGSRISLYFDPVKVLQVRWRARCARIGVYRMIDILGLRTPKTASKEKKRPVAALVYRDPRAITRAHVLLDASPSLCMNTSISFKPVFILLVRIKCGSHHDQDGYTQLVYDVFAHQKSVLWPGNFIMSPASTCSSHYVRFFQVKC